MASGTHRETGEQDGACHNAWRRDPGVAGLEQALHVLEHLRLDDGGTCLAF
jgi:hypothetical protein